MLYELCRYEAMSGKMAPLHELTETLAFPVFTRLGITVIGDSRACAALYACLREHGSPSGSVGRSSELILNGSKGALSWVRNTTAARSSRVVQVCS
jgi:hypothetical protein